MVKDLIIKQPNNQQILISATFTATPILSAIDYWKKAIGLEYVCRVLNYNQLFQELLSQESQFSRNESGLNVILFRFQDWIPYKSEGNIGLAELPPDSEEFKSLKVGLQETMQEFLRILEVYLTKTAVPTLIMLCPASEDCRAQEHCHDLFQELGDLLLEHTKGIDTLHILRTDTFHSTYKIEAVDDPIRNEIGHIPYLNHYYHFLGTLLIRYYYSLISKGHKVIVVDCDHTLWQGVCGEIGYNAVRLDDSLKAFQQFLVKQHEEGMLICLCSKNSEKDVWDVFDNRLDFPLKRIHLTDTRINWKHKSENVESLAESLNLGMDSFIFIDDNPVECAEVQANCPEVLVLQWPKEEEKRKDLINHTWAFDHFVVTAEDSTRTTMTRQNLQRKSLFKESVSLDNFIEKLELQIDIERISSEHLARVSQLTKRTNQFNFTTIRRNQSEIKKSLDKKGFEGRVVYVKDRFGEYGLVGVLLFKQADHEIIIDSFLLSCRVLGRGVEQAMMAELGKYAFAHKLSRVIARFSETDKNQPAREFLEGIMKRIPNGATKEMDDETDLYIYDAKLLKELQCIPDAAQKPAFSLAKGKLASSTVGMQVTVERIKEPILLTSIQQIAEAVESTNSFPNKESIEVILNDFTQEKYSNILEKVINIFSSTLSIEASHLNISDPIEDYVTDSLLIVELTAALQKKFSSVTPTFLFEYSSLAEIAQAVYQGSSTERQIIAAGNYHDEEEVDASNPFEVAIIGMNGKFPNSENIDRFWANLLEGASCISEVPLSRWDSSIYYDPNGEAEDKPHSKWGGFIEDVDCFDNAFFNISPKEAELMDPQQRIFLEVVWGMLEDASYTRKNLPPDTGIFVGVISNDYNIYASEAALSGLSSYRAAEMYQIPNRVSYFMDLHGPSMAIDTACSASGTAIHLAYESMKHGECASAIVGGVNLFLHPSRYIQYSQMQMLTKDKQCCPFGAEARGTLFGEGIGALLLKPLSQAKKDNDNIYAVIKATAINSGGKTNGFTVPNPGAQAELIAKALCKANISARTISYVEAHGTGTPLGDPIEVRGLTKAFQDTLTDHQKSDYQYCALGSVKSNIGHLESGAAIASIIKTVMQMKNKTLVPSLHSGELNPMIHFESTPFFVPQEKMEWKQPILKDDDNNEQLIPRRAGISSFGAGGSNSHIILEEFEYSSVLEEDQANVIPLIILSAQSKAALRVMAINLTAFIDRHLDEKHLLRSISYNLQVGREEFKWRLAIICESILDLRNKLETFLEGKTGSNQILSGSIQGKSVTQLNFGHSELDKNFIDSLCQLKEYERIASLWIMGAHVEWQSFYQGNSPRRISLPTYPFQKERHWLPNVKSALAKEAMISGVHPLLQQNTSDFSGQQFKSCFTGREFFLKDHIVKGHQVLPGVAYLEMAYAAASASVENLIEGQYRIRLSNVVWTRPILVDQHPVWVDIRLTAEDEDEILFEVFSSTEEQDVEPVLHSQGCIQVIQESDSLVIDLQELREQCGQIWLSEQCYAIFKAMELDYGLAHQGIDTLYVGVNQVVAKLILPASVADTLDQYVLHPSLMDSALQASVGLMTGLDQQIIDASTRLASPLPFYLEELEVFGKCTSEMWAVIRYSSGTNMDNHIQKIDIDLCDNQGNVCIQIRGYSTRLLEGEMQSGNGSSSNEASTSDSLIGTINLTAVYEPVIVQMEEAYPSPTDRVVIIGGSEVESKGIRSWVPHSKAIKFHYEDTVDDMAVQLEGLGSIDHLVWIAPTPSNFALIEPSILDMQEQGVFQFFRIIKALLKLGYGSKDWGMTVVTVQAQSVHHNDPVNPLHSSLFGLLGSMAKEYPNWKVRIVDLEANCAWPISEICTLPIDSQGNPWVYRGREWYQQQLIPFLEDSNSGNQAYKKGGVYIVIGGAGGIGETWSEYMIRSYQAQIVWIGRREVNRDIEAQINRLASCGGPAPCYISADAGNIESLQSAYREIHQKYSSINGIIHAAIVLLDQSLANMKEERFRAALSAKVDVSVCMASVFKNEPLDFVLFFSSMVAFTKNPGQSNYAAGCTFKDTFAKQLSREWKCPVKVMNWGYWGNVGIVSSKVYQERMAQSGFSSIEAPEAMDALERLLGGQLHQMALVKTSKPRVVDMNLEETLTSYQETLPSYIAEILQRPVLTTLLSAIDSQKSEPLGYHDFLAKVQTILIQSASGLLKIGFNELDSDTALGEYGFDTVILNEFTNRVNELFDLELNASVFYEYSTFSHAAEHLVKQYETQLRETIGRKEQPVKSEGGLILREVDDLLYQILWAQLQSQGWFKEEREDITERLAATCVLEKYKRWMQESITVLERAHYLNDNGNSYVVADTSLYDVEALWEEWNTQTKPLYEDPNTLAQVRLVETTMRALPEILQGNVLATDVMFPNSSMDMVEGIYKYNKVADFYNEVLADMVIAYVEERKRQNPNVKLRILEVGAGTGGTSAMVFRKLRPYQKYIQEYAYTDLSKAFLLHAEKEYGSENPFLTYHIFHAGKPLAGQTINKDSFDIVISTNCLHATQNIRQALRNVKAAMRKNGLLLLNEMSGNFLFTHLTFGLLEGWWLYEDTALRIPGSPALSAESWQEVLEKEGFHDIHFPVREYHTLGQQIIIAEADGIVRQKRVEPAQSTLSKTKATVRTVASFQKTAASPGSAGSVSDLLREKSTTFMKRLVGGVLKMEYHKIDSYTPLEAYGIDSILVVHLTNQLRKSLDHVSSTLFFEYQTIDELVEHFLQTQKSSLIQLLGLDNQEPAVEDKPVKVVEEPQAKVSGVPNLLSIGTRKSFVIKPAEPKMTEQMSLKSQDIAVIGISGRFAGAENAEELWERLKSGTNCITEIPKDRWEWQSYYDREKGKSGRMYTKWGGFITDIDKFDPLFFSISPAEAEKMDPQERLFLEAAYSSIEDAGYTPETLGQSRKIGVFAGVMNGNYYTGASYWSIVNRVSYLFNFQGPSLAVDTACSSSLTAIHLALESLANGTSEIAIAGGVNLIVDPVHYVRLSEKTMLSTTDQCKAFGDHADGFVDGEGVGAIILKPLSKAVEDGDQIYGVIKSSMINAGGKTNGFTVPNPVAQSQMIGEAITRAGISARTISYVEAHGTGTALGDPIEIAGLSRAFAQDTQDTQYCSIGSLKPNIGHCESAAGVAGIMKVLLQLKHGQIAPSLHAGESNLNIDFSCSPFIVQHSLEEWKRPVIDGYSTPRRAGVSSFGAGGANAHIIIEEYDGGESQRPSMKITMQNPIIIVLSAKNENRLIERSRQLLEVLRKCKLSDVDLFDLSYTLQIGREAMEERLAFCADSAEALRDKLKAFVEGVKGIEDLYRGQIKWNKETFAVFSADEDTEVMIESWINKRKYSKVLDLWVKGFAIDWKRFYEGELPRRVSLPTYPFARERYWLSRSEVIDETVVAHYIHPLLHVNRSDFTEQRFSSVFTGKEFFLADHIIKGRRILSAAACLEMIRAAVEESIGELEHGFHVRLKNVVWASPILVEDQHLIVNIRLSAEAKGEISYEISRDGELGINEPRLYCTGNAEIKVDSIADTYDLQKLQEECCDREFNRDLCYDAFSRIGMDYGPSHRGIERMSIGGDQALAKLLLLPSTLVEAGSFKLHPGLLDSALQATMGLDIIESDFIEPSLPFALEDFEIYGECESSMWAIVRRDSSERGRGLSRFDIDICNEQGTVLIRMKGLCTRAAIQIRNSVEDNEMLGCLMVHPQWRVKPAEHNSTIPDYSVHLVVLCGQERTTQLNIEHGLRGVKCLPLYSESTYPAEQFKSWGVQVFEEIQTCFKRFPIGKMLFQVVVTTGTEGGLFSGLSGLLKTAQMENPNFIGQLIEIEPGEYPNSLLEKLKENSGSYSDNYIRYTGQVRHVAGWSEIVDSNEIVQKPWKDKGVYLITGGAGGVGLIFAEEIARNTNEAILILVGRSQLDEDKHVRLQAIRAMGISVVYKQTDITNKQAVHELIQQIKAEYGGLLGILHAAGIIKDNFIFKKSTEELEEVLDPKITGLVALDEASKDEDLDLFVLFSSTAGSLGSIGQADYSMANSFMDVYSNYRNTKVISGERRGHTLSINWPLWKDGGMRVDEETAKMMKRSLGMVAMSSALGIRSLYRALATGESQVMVIAGVLYKIREIIHREQPNPKSIIAVQRKLAAKPVLHKDSQQEKAIFYFKELVSSVIKLPAYEIETDEYLDKYGIDSIMIMKLTNRLEATFGSLSKTLFFEYRNINEITSYFIENYDQQLALLLGVGDDKSMDIVQSDASDPQENIAALIHKGRQPWRVHPQKSKLEEQKAEQGMEIAIIGLAGRYPDAGTVQEFWENLKSGKDSITEIPVERWDHSQYYDAEKNKPGKTYAKWGGFLSEVDRFDPLFFNISPIEAEMMDPQERLFLECAYATLQDAGYTRDAFGQHNVTGLGGNVGVYVGVMYDEYQLFGVEETAKGRPLAISANPSSIANRVSYFCNFNGPSLAVDTMCSSSLTAIHLACESLQRGSCEAALAGGVNVSIHPNKYLLLAQGKFASSKGKCESFGENGDGYVPGEGVGAVLLKPLAKAVADGDQIYAVIKGSAINHGGKTNGYTVPNPNAQAEVIKRVFRESDIDARTISYIEAHGTGTALGDPVEITGLTKAFQVTTMDKQFCSIGSVKSNIGHCEGAAGIAGVTKVLLQLKNRQLVPSLHSTALNPNIDFNNTPFTVQQTLTEWNRPVVYNKEFPRRAGISCFGAGGSNAHLIIEEYTLNDKKQVRDHPLAHPVIILLSAKDEGGLKEQAYQLRKFIDVAGLSDDDLPDISYTLQCGREAMEERAAIIVESIHELQEKLLTLVDGSKYPLNVFRGQVKRNNGTFAELVRDSDMRATIDKWISSKKYEKLLDLWTQGMPVDWEKFYGNEKPNRISLPTYPFAGNRYWVSRGVTTDKGSRDRVTANSTENMDKFIYYKEWKRQPLVPTLGARLGMLIVLNTLPFAKIASDLFINDEDIHVVNVFHGKGEYDSNGYSCDFYSEQSGELLYQILQEQQQGLELLGIIDLTAQDREYELSETVEAGKLRFLQLFIEQHRNERWKILQVTYQLQDHMLARTTMQGARLAGLYRMLSAEYKEIQSWTMDSDYSIEEDRTKLAKQIMDEFLNGSAANSTEVCYRLEKRYAPRLISVSDRTNDAQQFHTPNCYSEQDVILITGGSRGVGAEVAKHAAAHGAKKMVIIGRKTLPEISKWKETTGEKEIMDERIRDMMNLMDQGVQIVYSNTSLTDEAGLLELFNSIHLLMGPVTGVFHCAGTGSDHPAFIKKPIANIERVCEPKMKGLVTLHKAMKNEPLAFFILFSSVSSIVPVLAAGQSDYALANSYMDNYARYQQGVGNEYVKSIQWPAWTDTGMSKEGTTIAYQRTGLLSNSVKDGLAFLDKLARIPHAVSFPCVVDAERFSAERLLTLEGVRSKDFGVPALPPVEGLRTTERHEAIRQWLHVLFLSELKLTKEQLDEYKPFDEYGVDSILLAQLAFKMKDKLGARMVDPSLLLEYSTIAELTDYFEVHYPEYFDRHEALGIEESEPALERTLAIENKTALNSDKHTLPDAGLEQQIAVVGLSCRLPGSPNIEAYWKLLMQGTSAIKPIMNNRWTTKGRTDYGGWVDDIDQFDPGFFFIDEKDAEIMDPQARVILEESLKAIYDAGYDHRQLSNGKVGVYIGGRSQPHADLESLLASPNPIMGIGQNYLATNISRFFNFKGVSLVVDTACSSAITTMMLAADALRGGRIEMALVGSVSLLLNSFTHETFAARNILSEDGKMRIFDKHSNGEVLGEGAGVVVLKRLNDAIRDGNQIYGVIKGISMNNDGRTLGPGSPNLNAQKQVMREALEQSGTVPGDVGYIEVNGSGSLVTDSVEIKALSDVYSLQDSELATCRLGSIKPNVGHLLLSSGLAGFIRCLLSVHHKQIPPFLSAYQPFEYYDFAASRIEFNREAVAWETTPGKKRIAAQNSFPDGGTNCHVLIEEFVPDNRYMQLLFPKSVPPMERRMIPGSSDPQFCITNFWGGYNEKSI